jgi:uncharacterized protein (DUF697 family)
MKRANRRIHTTSIFAGVTAAILSPIPLIDELILFPTYLGMTYSVGKASGLRLTKIPWRASTRTAMNGLMARAGLNLAFMVLPGVAAAANAISAVALTELYGAYLKDACAAPESARPIGPRAIAGMLKARLSRSRFAARTPA